MFEETVNAAALGQVSSASLESSKTECSVVAVLVAKKFFCRFQIRLDSKCQRAAQRCT